VALSDSKGSDKWMSGSEYYWAYDCCHCYRLYILSNEYIVVSVLEVILDRLKRIKYVLPRLGGSRNHASSIIKGSRLESVIAEDGSIRFGLLIRIVFRIFRTPA
jgi:hypothetical protein